MKKAIGFIVTLFLLTLTSCSNFNVVKKVKVIDDSLYFGCFSTCKTDEENKEFDVILYLNFVKNGYDHEENSLRYDCKINFNKDDLQVISDDFIDESGNVLKFFDVSNLFSEYLDGFTSVKKYFEQNALVCFFSYGELNDSDALVTGEFSISNPGVYYFSTVSEKGDVPSYSFAKIYREEVRRFNN